MTPKPCVIDVVDITGEGGTYWRDSLDGYNTHTISIGAMSNAVEQMVSSVLARTGGKPVLRCLAIWGHGAVDADENPLGIHLLTAAKYWEGIPHQSALTRNTILYLDLHQALQRLKPTFAVGGRAELRGCGAAATADGIEVMKMLAARWGVPIHASKKNQPTMSWLPPVVEVTPAGDVRETRGVEYNLRM